MAINRTEETGSGAIDVSRVATGNEEVMSVAITFDVAPTTSENITIKHNDAEGVPYDVTLLTYDPSSPSTTELVWYPDSEQLMVVGDSIDVAFANSDTRTYGVTIIVETTDKQTNVVQRKLSEIMIEVAKLLGGYRSALAESGSVTTVVDSKRAESDDYFNQGTIFMIDTMGDDAPILEYSEITDFVQSTGEFTLTPAFTAAPGANDRYGVIPSYAPDKILEAINITLYGVPYKMTDETSITIADDQSEYELPTHISAVDIKEVHVQGNSDSNDNQWIEVYNWGVYTQGPGKNDLLVMPYGLAIDSTTPVKITYVTRHKSVYSFDSYIDKSIPTERIIYRAANWLLMERWGESTGNETLQGRMNYLLERAEAAEAAYSRQIPFKQPKIMKPW